MTDSYLTLVSPRGVELLCQETLDARRFFSRRCERSAGELACYWVVLPCQEAVRIRRLTRAGGHAAAQRLLDETTLDAGLVSPDLGDAVYVDRLN